MKKKAVGNMLADFKAAHDRSTRFADRIREGLKSLATEGREAWEPEGKFIRRCGIAAHMIGDLREEFKDHIVNVSRTEDSKVKRVWFADKRVAAKARG